MTIMELLDGIAEVSTAIIVGSMGIMFFYEIRRRRRDRARAAWWRQVEVAIHLAVGRPGDPSTASGIDLLEQLRADDRADHGDSELISGVLAGLEGPETNRANSVPQRPRR